jgi:hypothetical protein
MRLGAGETGKIMDQADTDRIENFRQYAADCVRQANAAQTPQDKNILLNVALAWIRLARQSQAAEIAADEFDMPAGATPLVAAQNATQAVPAA